MTSNNKTPQYGWYYATWDSGADKYNITHVRRSDGSEKTSRVDKNNNVETEVADWVESRIRLLKVLPVGDSIVGVGAYLTKNKFIVEASADGEENPGA